MKYNVSCGKKNGIRKYSCDSVKKQRTPQDPLLKTTGIGRWIQSYPKTERCTENEANQNVNSAYQLMRRLRPTAVFFPFFCIFFKKVYIQYLLTIVMFLISRSPWSSLHAELPLLLLLEIISFINTKFSFPHFQKNIKLRHMLMVRY